jgi:hypothetical protein
VITQEELKRVLHYEPETGVFTWLVSCGAAAAGSMAGHLHVSGYVYIKILRTKYKAHRLAHLYMTGKWPIHDIDHFNRVKDDNRWGNLRPATKSQNQSNVGLRLDNTSGLKGLSWNSGRQCWVVQVGGECGEHSSRHKCKLNAVATLYRLQKIIHGEFSNV